MQRTIAPLEMHVFVLKQAMMLKHDWYD